MNFIEQLLEEMYLKALFSTILTPRPGIVNCFLGKNVSSVLQPRSAGFEAAERRNADQLVRIDCRWGG
jgi:hypothetical protein